MQLVVISITSRSPRRALYPRKPTRRVAAIGPLPTLTTLFSHPTPTQREVSDAESSSSASTAPDLDLSQRKRETDLQVEEAIRTISSESALIDAIANIRNWFGANESSPLSEIVTAYLNTSINAADTATSLATPIEETYTTADHGRAILRSEEVAKDQRQYWSPEEAEKRWGVELPKEDLPALIPSDKPTTEGQLWQLWYCVLHNAKKMPWRDEEAQGRLVELVSALKARPDPPPPSKATVALKQDWVWASSVVWSELLLLGPAARETWNDCPGCGAGYTPPEVHAWTNVNAFTARLTRDGVHDFWNFALWAMRDAVDEELAQQWPQHVPLATKLDALLPAAAVWVLILGKALKERDQQPPEKNQTGKPSIYWPQMKSKLQSFKLNKDLSEETRELVAEALAKIEEVDGE